MESGDRREKTKYHIDAQWRRGFYLNDVVVLPNEGTVICRGERLHLPPKAMEVLLFLVQNRNRLLSVQKLLVFGWGDVDAKRGNLTHVISEIRQALDDQKACPEYIQTLQGRGYRLIAKVLPLDEKVHYNQHWPLKRPSHTQAGSKLNSDNQWHLSLALFKNSRLFSVTIAFVVSTWVLIQVFEVLFPIFGIPDWGLKIAVLVLVVGFPLALLYTWLKEIKIKKVILARQAEDGKRHFFFKQLAVDFAFIGLMSIGVGYLALFLIDSIETETNAPINQVTDSLFAIPIQDDLVAAVPFEFNAVDRLPDYFKATLHSELLLALANQRNFKLVSQRAVGEMNPNATLADYAKKLGARYLLEGKVFAEQDGFTIMLSLADTQTAIQVWGSSIQGNPDELLKVPKELYRQVFNAFALLAEKPAENFNVISTNDFKAYDSYIQAKSHLANANQESELKLAELRFLEALKSDPTFSLATAGLCQTYLDLYEMNSAVNSFQAAKNQCGSLLSKSQQSEGQLKAGGYVALASLNRISGQHETAIELYQQAITLSPNDIEAITGMAKSSQALGRYEQADEFFHRVISIEPGYWKNYSNLGDFLFSIGNYKGASEQYARVTLMRPTDAQAFNRLGAAYYLNFQMDDASLAWSQSLEIEPSAANYSNLGTALFFSGKFERAAENYLKAVNLQTSDPILWSNLGDAQKFARQPENSIESFTKALKTANAKLSVNPTDQELIGVRARVLSELGQCQEALTIVDAIGAGNITEPYLYYDLSLATLRCQDFDRAKQMIVEAVALGYPREILEKDIQFAAIINQLTYKSKE